MHTLPDTLIQRKEKFSQHPAHPGSAMSIKGGEAAVLLSFVIWEMEQLGGLPVFGAPLFGAAVSLQRILDLRRDVGGRPGEAIMRTLRAQVDVHQRCCKRAGIAVIPKTHQMMHMVDRWRLPI